MRRKEFETAQKDTAVVPYPVCRLSDYSFLFLVFSETMEEFQMAAKENTFTIWSYLKKFVDSLYTCVGSWMESSDSELVEMWWHLCHLVFFYQ